MLGEAGHECPQGQHRPLLVHELLDVSCDPGVDGVEQVPESLPVRALGGVAEAVQTVLDLPPVVHQGGLPEPYRPALENLYGGISAGVVDEPDVLALDPIPFPEQVRMEQFGMLAVFR
jgi:hypothetical protein